MILNSKKYFGEITQSKNLKGYYDFRTNGRIIFSFTYEGNEIIILNEKYQFSCDSRKFIPLHHCSNPMIEKASKEYIKANDYILADPEGLLEKAHILYNLGRLKICIIFLRHLLQRQPAFTKAYLLLGDSYWKLDQLSKARENYRKYIHLLKTSTSHDEIPEHVLERLKK
jgi:tetratricopeptide (TPR) repeat protein